MVRAPFWYPPILAYHRIHPDGRTDTPTIPPDRFSRQMALLAAHWRPISLGELVDCLERGAPPPDRSVAVTFDDGTDDFFTHALPILAEHRIPAAVFVIAGNVGRPGSLTPTQLTAISSRGICLGSHTLSHDYLPSMSLARAEESLSLSKQLLERSCGRVEFLSYPAGGFTPEIARAARSLGYRAACTTNRGHRRHPIDRWALRRISMRPGTESRFGMWLRCSGYYGFNRRLRPPA